MISFETIMRCILIGIFAAIGIAYIVSICIVIIETIKCAAVVTNKLVKNKIINDSQTFSVFLYTLKFMIKFNFTWMIFHPLICEHCTTRLTYVIMDNNHNISNYGNPIFAVHELIAISCLMSKDQL